MKAIRIHGPGGPQDLRLEEVETPVPGEGDVLIKVAVAGVNFADQLALMGPPPGMEGGPHPVTFPSTPGFEVAGTIAALGRGVTGLAEGQRVAAILPTGGYAEYALARANTLAFIPQGVEDSAAIALLLVQGLTAYGLLHEASRFQAGESVLVEAAAGGVGSLAVQMARLAGAGKVIGLASTPQKLELVKSLGADYAIDYTQPDWTKQVYEATDGRGVDIVLDSVSGPVGGQAFSCLARRGRMVMFGGASGQPLPLQNLQGQLSMKNLTLTGFGMQADSAQAGREAISQYLKEGRLRAVIGQSFPLAQAGEALVALRSRQTVGKVVLTV